MKIKLLFLLALQLGYSQNASVRLNFINTPDSVAIVASKSITNNAGFFLSNTDTIYTKDNKAVLNFNPINAGYMYFSFSKANPGIAVLFEPGEDIILDVSRNQDNKYHIHYTGKNSPLLSLINTDTVYKYPLLSKKLRNVIFEANSGSEILEYIKHEYEDARSKLQALHREEKISDEIFAVSKLHLDSTLAFNTKGIIEDIFRVDEEFIKTKLPRSEFIILLNDVMSEFNLFDDRFQNFASVAFFDGLQSTAKFINESGASSKIHNKDLWKNKNVREYYNYIPLHYQERLFAYLFVNDRLDENDLNQFKKVFPNSKYSDYLITHLNNKEDLEYETAALVYFINNKFEYVRQVKDIDINSIISDNFQGKPVFVDLWAAYCAPCFQEFSHSQKLFAFLKTNSIEMLYIAMIMKEI